MAATDATFHILERIQQSIASLHRDMTGMREDMTSMREDMTGMREDMTNLERHVVANGEVLGIVHERLSFFERAATTATEARARLEPRIEQLEGRVYDIDTRVGVLEAKDGDGGTA